MLHGAPLELHHLFLRNDLLLRRAQLLVVVEFLRVGAPALIKGLRIIEPTGAPYKKFLPTSSRVVALYPLSSLCD